MSQQDYQLKNQQLAQQFFNFFSFQPPDVVHSFLSITQRKEPDTQPVIQALQSRGVTIVISQCDFSQNLLSHYQYTSETVLISNRWGIPEPAGDQKKFPVQAITAILVPLLAFDRQGQRVGYGKGYYDHFLKECPSGAIKIGLSFEPPIEKIEDTDAWDVPLDYCVTPEQVWVFRK